MTCKECFNFELCANGYGEVTADTEITNIKGKQCHYFKDRSKMIELPCKVGDVVYEIIEETVPRHYFYIGAYEVEDVSAKEVKYAGDWVDYRKYPVYFSREQAEQALREKT
jgi:hypothetical protein